jgi:predicted aminopeptidase
MTEEELEQLRRNLARLSDDGVKRAYQTAWEEARMRGDRLPPAKAVQQLVQAFRQLWRWRH